MIHDERGLADWLQEGPVRGPADGLARTLASTRQVRQRPAWMATLSSPVPRAVSAPGTVAWRFGDQRTWVVLVALVALLAIVGALVIGRDVSRPRNLLAYCADARTFTVPVQGGTPTRVLDERACDLQWSPDGTWLMASSWDTADIWIVRGDGTGARIVASGTRPRWSPDGRSIAFMRAVDGTERPVIRDLRSGDEQPLEIPDALGQAELFGWVDREHVLVRDCAACETSADTVARWWVLPGGGRAPIDEPRLTIATLSPDGARLAWSRCSWRSMANCGGLLVTEVATGETTQIAPPPKIAYDPMTWDPDAETIVYPEGDTVDSASHLAATRLDGTRVPMTLPWDTGLMTGAYSAGDERLAVVHQVDATETLYVLDAGGALRTVASAHAIGSPVWQPALSAVALTDPAPAAPNPCTGTVTAAATVQVDVTGDEGCIRVFSSGEGGLYALNFDPRDALPDLLSDEVQAGSPRLAPMSTASLGALEAGDACLGATSAGGQPSWNVVVAGRVWCLTTSSGAVVRLAVHDTWSYGRPVELDYIVLTRSADAASDAAGPSEPRVQPSAAVSAPAATRTPSDAPASFAVPSPPSTPPCDAPPTPDGAVAAGCVVVPQSWTVSLDQGAVTTGPADLWYEAVTDDELYLTRSYDWPGASTELRRVPGGGRQACLDALAEPDPSPATWPIPSSPDDFPDQPHGIPFASLEGDVAACVTTRGGHLFEVRLAGTGEPATSGGPTFSPAALTWIDWGTR